jgi:hypothetical protein
MFQRDASTAHLVHLQRIFPVFSDTFPANLCGICVGFTWHCIASFILLVLFMPPPKSSTLAHTSFGCYSFFSLPLPTRGAYPASTKQFYRWGVVQLVGHLTVNEDGEGSNPSAPAKFLLNRCRSKLCASKLLPIDAGFVVLHCLVMRFLPALLLLFPFQTLLLQFHMPSTAAQHLTRPDVPEKLAAPVSEEVILQAHASGSQVYVCQAGSDQKLAWVLKAPEAELFNSDGAAIGKHFGGPTWKHTDGSAVVGKVVARQDAPDADAIPWLLLAATSHSGSGTFAAVTSIQRIHTKGGLPPPSGCDAPHRDAESKIPYSADYYFYAPAH